MIIIFGSDEKTPLTDSVYNWLVKNGHTVTLAGHLIDENMKWHWAEIGRDIGKRVGNKEFEMGIACCWSGTGIALAANKEDGARAVLSWDAETAKLGRKWDDANILCFSLRYTSDTLAQEILHAWFKEPFNEETLDQVKFVR
ncbi:RpiB/LacA/LacB family sugar-phosphate isomerase [bacterium]|nr:RpiB/LacA/LacB family sugar-phosphate isomerase [bacterium]